MNLLNYQGIATSSPSGGARCGDDASESFVYLYLICNFVGTMESKNRNNLRMLLAQARKDKVMIDNEYRCFLRSSGLSGAQLVAHDLTQEPLGTDALNNFDCLAIGGSGDFSVLETIPNEESLADVLLLARRVNFPVLGACLGAQIIAKFFGGEVAGDREHQELGTYTIRKTVAGRRDPFFAPLPNSFKAQAGHNDRISHLPKDAILLAQSDICLIQAFTFPGSKIYALQFHPDLDKENFMARLNHYRAAYADKPEEYEAVLRRAEESPEASNLVGDFINRIVLQ